MPDGTIYLDHAATCPPLPRVQAAIAAAMAADLGNPEARHHAPGRTAAAVVDRARAALAALVGCRSDELVFTSGASEAISHAVFGVAESLLRDRPVMVAGAADHAATTAALARVAGAGGIIRTMPVDRQGRIPPAALSAIDDRTALVCLLHVNNETGVIADPAPVADICRRHGALLLLDASQAPLRMPVDLAASGADLAVLSAHKMHGPGGLGALWIRRGLGLPPLIAGGGQEGGRRGGTPPVHALAGWAAACEWLRSDGPAIRARLRDLGERLEARLREGLPGLVVQGAGVPRAPGITMVTLPGLGRRWLPGLRRVAASAGSACGSGTGEPSRVLTAMGLPAAEAVASLRLSLGAGSDGIGVDAGADEIIAAAGNRP
jgi:cysteine desulfurase